MVKTFEDYRLSIALQGQRYKVLGHSVREDETLQVRVRSRPRPRSAGFGKPVLTDRGLALIASDGPTPSSVRAVHYHPSGRINIKRQDAAHWMSIQGPPLQMLPAPIGLIALSVPEVTRLDPENRKPNTADYVFSLDDFPLKRIHAELQVGPKGSFNGPITSTFGLLQRIVYSDAALYDVAYFVGEAVPMDDSIMIGGVVPSMTSLTLTVSQIDFDRTKIPVLSAAVWSSPPAIARQIRAFLEKSIETLRAKIGSSNGGYEARITSCRDGAIVGVDWNSNIEGGSYTFAQFDQLSRAHVLAILGAANGGDGTLVDVNALDPLITGGIADTVFVRQRHGAGPERVNALVFSAGDPPSGPRPYWRIVPSVLVHPGRIIDLIPTIHQRG